MTVAGAALSEPHSNKQSLSLNIKGDKQYSWQLCLAKEYYFTRALKGAVYVSFVVLVRSAG
jgi:hypothetical protein